MDKEYFKDYYHLERNHWWFKARLEILENVIKSRILRPERPSIRILNAGVATGATTLMLENFGTVDSLEFDIDCCKFLEDELGMTVTNGSLTELPYSDGSYDLVCAFDVIEHIEDDAAALREIKRVLKPEGIFFITVPAFEFLWSEHDVINHHFRRYTKSLLASRISGSGLTTEFISYFNFWLFAPIAAVRVLSNKFSIKGKPAAAKSDFKKMRGNKMINKLFFNIFLSEKKLLIRGKSFPRGISLMAYGSKVNT